MKLNEPVKNTASSQKHNAVKMSASAYHKIVKSYGTFYLKKKITKNTKNVYGNSEVNFS